MHSLWNLDGGPQNTKKGNAERPRCLTFGNIQFLHERRSKVRRKSNSFGGCGETKVSLFTGENVKKFGIWHLKHLITYTYTYITAYTWIFIDILCIIAQIRIHLIGWKWIVKCCMSIQGNTAIEIKYWLYML